VTVAASAQTGEPVEDSASPSRWAATVPPASAWWVLIAGVIGLIASTTLTVEKIELLRNPSYVPSCNINPIVSCGSVMTTPQASVLGFPNSLIGIAAFTIVTVTGASRPNAPKRDFSANSPRPRRSRTNSTRRAC